MTSMDGKQLLDVFWIMSVHVFKVLVEISWPCEWVSSSPFASSNWTWKWPHPVRITRAHSPVLSLALSSQEITSSTSLTLPVSLLQFLVCDAVFLKTSQVHKHCFTALPGTIDIPFFSTGLQMFI